MTQYVDIYRLPFFLIFFLFILFVVYIIVALFPCRHDRLSVLRAVWRSLLRMFVYTQQNCTHRLPRQGVRFAFYQCVLENTFIYEITFFMQVLHNRMFYANLYFTQIYELCAVS